MRRRLESESGIALVMAIGIMSVLMVAGSAVVFYAGANARSSEHSADDARALNLGEAGMNYARAILWNADDPTSATAVVQHLAAAIAHARGRHRYVLRHVRLGDEGLDPYGHGTYTTRPGVAAPVSRTATSQVQVTRRPRSKPPGAISSRTRRAARTSRTRSTSMRPSTCAATCAWRTRPSSSPSWCACAARSTSRTRRRSAPSATRSDLVEVGGGCRYPWSGAYVSTAATPRRVYREASPSPPEHPEAHNRT